MEYTFVRDGIPETVKPETWGWGVVYKDGTELKQFGDDGVFHQFKEIDQLQVKMFVMYKLDDMSKRFDVVVSGDFQLFHFYKRFTFAALTPAETKKTVYVFGYKKNGQAVYHYILPDDRLVIADNQIEDLTQFAL